MPQEGQDISAHKILQTGMLCIKQHCFFKHGSSYYLFKLLPPNWQSGLQRPALT